MNGQQSFPPDGPLVAEPDDWIDLVQGPLRARLRETLRSLALDRLQRFPPRKEGKVPFGHELRVFGRFCTGDNALFDPSAFWRVYRWFASRRERSLYRAFVASEPLSRAEWSELLGQEQWDAWLEHKLLRSSEEGWRCRFRAVPFGGLTLLSDPDEPSRPRRVALGQDSFNLVQFLKQQPWPRVQRYLDVGPGSGVALLTMSPHCEEAVGLDINPRAVAISRLNAELNGNTSCTIHEGDVMKVGGQYGRFDRITWNCPFVFLPADYKATHLEAYGGHLGIEVVLNFLRVLPGLLADQGKAYLGASAPILASGVNLLESQVQEQAADLGLDVVVHVLQAYWHPHHRRFHEAHGIRQFELVHLEITPGRGLVRRINPPWGTRLVGVGRRLAYRVWK